MAKKKAFGYFVNMTKNERQRILLIRHGESEGNTNPKLYIARGDSKIGLTEKGWHQTAATGRFLAQYYSETDTAEWPLIHVSPHQRTQESLSGILYGMGNIFKDDPKIYPQSFLTEKFFGAASALEFLDDEKVSKEAREMILTLSRLVNANDPFQAKHLFGESSKDTMMAVKLMMETLGRDADEGKRDHLIPCHGEVILMMLMNGMHIMPQDKKKIGKIGNADVIEILGTKKIWQFRRIWDGEKSVRLQEDLRLKVPRFTVADLPPIPDFLKAAP